MKSRRRTANRIWLWPAILSMLVTAGLLSALLGQTGIWLPLSWAMLAMPLCIIAITAVKYSLPGQRRHGAGNPVDD